MRGLRALLVALSLAAGCSGSSTVVNPGGDGGYVFDPCIPMPAPGYDPAARGLTACCTGTGPAHCVPSSQVLPALAMQLNMCPAAGTLCLPDPIIRAGGNYMPAPCTSSVGKAQGVCLSQCIPLVANNPQSSVLGQDGCGDGELCVPCKNPFNGMSTGACNINDLLCRGGADGGAGDGGSMGMCPYTGPPVIDPNGLAPCAPACMGAHCLPANVVPTAQQSLLAKCTTTAGMAGLCAPDPLIAAGGNYVPPTCTSVAGAEGRCISTCLPSVAAQAAQLPQDTCKAGEKCAPCFNPIAADPTAPTGACTVACDKPAKPPTMITCPWTGPPLTDPNSFPACAPACAGAHCVPAADVPMAERALLATCPGGFCAPDAIIATGGKTIPKTCTSIAGAEGRCISTCLPVIAAQAAQLPKDVCATGERCAPCFNPVATDPTAPTGACTIGCDKAAKPPTMIGCPYSGPPIIDPSTFPQCDVACAGAHCVPAADVPMAQQALLAPCAGNTGFCAPDSVVAAGGHYVPPTCTSVAGAEGRCLSTCLPQVAAQASLLPQDTCAAGTRCVPCFNPTAADPNKATGACSLACDKPTRPPVILMCPWTGPNVVDPASFPDCSSATCTGAHCLPTALVPAAQQALLSACPGGFCAPDPIIQTDNNYVPPTCNAFNGTVSEGRCTSTCIPSVQAQASQLHQHTCNAGELCAPCYDPFTAASTGACGLACDKPANAPYTFPTCCPYNGADTGTCVPTENVPASQQSSLQQLTCPTTLYCVPDENLPSGAGPASCNNFLLGRGTCLSNCLSLGIGGIFGQGSCPGNHKCIPCSVAPAGTPGC